MEKTARPPVSLPMVAAVLTALLAFFLSTHSPFALIPVLGFLASLSIPFRFERDAANMWGLRLLLYITLAVLGRAPVGASSYLAEVQAFTTAGLIAGGEIVLQAFRSPLPGARFEGWIVSLSSIIFLIACNSNGLHMWVLAPLYMLFMLLSLADLRPRAARNSSLSSTRRATLLIGAVLLGLVFHQIIWSHRGSIMAAGAQMVGTQRPALGNMLSNTPRMTNSFAQSLSTARLMTIRGALNDPHLRASTFWRYREGSWGPAQRLITPALPSETREQDGDGTTLSDTRTDIDVKITILRPTNGVVFAPLNIFALVPESGTSFDWDRFQGPVKTVEMPPVNYGIINSRAETKGIQTTQGPLCIQPNAEQQEQLLTIPDEIDPRVSQLAREAARQGVTPAEKAALLVEFLLHNNKYSLDFVRSEQDPISDFVLHKKAAHCQYFAASLTMMLRAVGIPARYATGYYANEIEANGQTVVRGRDAHAWTEAFITGVGWVALDATPPTGRADASANPLPWHQKWLERFQDQFAWLRAWFGNLTQIQIIGIFTVILLLWGAERWRQSLKTTKKRPKGPVIPAEMAPLARRFERVLSKRGITLSPGRPWSEIVPETLEAERRWIETYNQVRFDGQGRARVPELDDQLKQLEKTRSSP